MAKVRQVLEHLIHARFKKIWRGDHYANFYEFLCREACPARGFLLSVPLNVIEYFDARISQSVSLALSQPDGFIWFYYEIEIASDGDIKSGLPKIIIPTEEETYREVPQELKGYPVWRLNFTSI